MKKEISYERYQRQMILPGFGEEAQQRLSDARVLVIGAGGLGCPALQYLTAAGVGKIGMADGDMVSLSNLHRQVLFHTSDIGKNKAEVAAAHLQQLNPEINILSIPENVNNQNLLQLLTGFDIVIDGTDNFATRYMINDACVLMNKILVYGAVSRFEGQVSVFNYPLKQEERSSNYRDLFPEPPKEDEVLNCADAGVIGVLPGIIGTMQASETIKLITGQGNPLVNQLLTFNAMTNQFFTIKIAAKKETVSLMPHTAAAFQATDYAWLCGASFQVSEIDARTFDGLIGQHHIDVIDVREPDEMPLVSEFQHLRIPLTQIITASEQLKSDTVVVFCQSGKRSRQAAKLLSEQFGTTKRIHSLQGGILAWKTFCQTK
jgi:molybdopterin/thiamine biosynthesis adenylyltransferase/rhodanese-related sulfurtransferase